MQDFTGKVCIITGAASGIGRACALELALNCHAQVGLADLNEEALQNVVQEISGQGGQAVGVPCDISKENDVKKLISETVEKFGRLDYLASIAAATSFSFTSRDRDFESFDVDYMLEAFRINTCGSYLLIKHAIPHMLQAGGGAIVCASSVAARFGAAGNNVYGMTKAALEALVRGTAGLYGRKGIRANAIEISNTVTPSLLETLPAEAFETMKLGILNPDFTGGDKIAKVVAFLLSDDAYTIQGATVPTDNGYHIVAGMSAAMEANGFVK